MFFMPPCGCLSENVSVCECVCDCERESERERDGDLNKRKEKTSRECLCVSVFFQEVMPLAPNILQLWHLNDSLYWPLVCLPWLRWTGCTRQGQGLLFSSLCLYFFTILQHPHRDFPTASSPFPFLLALWSFFLLHCVTVYSLKPGVCPLSTYSPRLLLFYLKLFL